MPLTYDDIPGSWGTQSEGWPETPYTIGKWLLCTKAHVVPYGSYVTIAPNYPDYKDAVIRIENENLKQKLEESYDGMFVKCRHLLKKEFA
jgi:hypothetical protein